MWGEEKKGVEVESGWRGQRGRWDREVGDGCSRHLLIRTSRLGLFMLRDCLLAVLVYAFVLPP